MQANTMGCEEDPRKRARENSSRITEFINSSIPADASAPEAASDVEDNELFVSQAPAPKRLRRLPILSNREVRESMAVGLNEFYSNQKGCSPDMVFKTISQKKRRANSKANELDLATLFNSDIIADGQANAQLSSIPTSTQGNKEKALKELIASIPKADQEEAKPDKQAVLDATRKFNCGIKTDKKGGWKHPKLKTSLYHHQILGAAFMRDRENSTARPHGGMLCDVMGLGKTIQTLANIVDGESVELEDNARTTLIVVPRAVMDHWRSQIDKHVEWGVLRVLFYYSGSRPDSNEALDLILDCNVVITSYDEVRRSYPKLSKPDSMDDKETQLLSEREYKKGAGPLHQVRFRRIILDEGHMIRNPESQTSISVRALHAHFKWILSGTPLLNRVAEFWPYFNFLGVPNIGKYANFIKNYCDGTDIANKRLINVLRAVVFRRTYAARLFAHPIVLLPEIGERTHSLEPSTAEKVLYDMIQTMFVDNINSMATMENQEAQNRCFLTMILKLRMCNSHPLIVQDILKVILKKEENMAKLISLVTENAGESDPNRILVGLIQGLKALEKKDDTYQRPPTPTLNSHFRKFLDGLKDQGNNEEYTLRTKCVLCNAMPTETKVTPCMHLICGECLLVLRECANDVGDALVMCPGGCNVAVCNEEPFELSPSILDSRYGLQAVPSTTKGSKGKSKQGKDNLSKYVILGDNIDDRDDIDWVRTAGGEMPSSKVTATRELIRQWMAETVEENGIIKPANNKVVIFTQFRDMVTIFCQMCSKENWGSTTLTGDMSFLSRQESIRDFGEKEEIKIMIASLKTGGIGLDLTMANKCILIEPWWNDAIQQQAFCRLFRIGQERSVEVVKLTIEHTIDEYMMDLQKEKNQEIEGAIGDAALAGRNTNEELLKLFGEVEHVAGGGFIIHRRDE